MDDAMLVRDARARYYTDNGFSEAMYSDSWVRVKFGPIPIVFPNTTSRKRALPMHDLHHVATGYSTTPTGEAQIGAYEVAAGCGPHTAAWILNSFGFAGGLVIAPRRTYRAFVRGRHARTLYRTGWRDDLLDMTVGKLRTHLLLDRPAPRATWRDRLAFGAWVALFQIPALALIAIVLMAR
jgi:ubiquinone biosynthesis protein Coq4